MRQLIADAAAEVLFASPLQPSNNPGPADVRAAVQTWIRGGHTSRDALAVVAAEFGDHPDIAAARMCWCRNAVSVAYGCCTSAVAA